LRSRLASTVRIWDAAQARGYAPVSMLAAQIGPTVPATTTATVYGSRRSGPWPRATELVCGGDQRPLSLRLGRKSRGVTNHPLPSRTVRDAVARHKIMVDFSRRLPPGYEALMRAMPWTISAAHLVRRTDRYDNLRGLMRQLCAELDHSRLQCWGKISTDRRGPVNAALARGRRRVLHARPHGRHRPGVSGLVALRRPIARHAPASRCPTHLLSRNFPPPPPAVTETRTGWNCRTMGQPDLERPFRSPRRN